MVLSLNWLSCPFRYGEKSADIRHNDIASD